MMKISCVDSRMREFFFLRSIEVNSYFLPFLVCRCDDRSVSSLVDDISATAETHDVQEGSSHILTLLLPFGRGAREDEAAVRGELQAHPLEAVLLLDFLAKLERIVEVLLVRLASDV